MVSAISGAAGCSTSAVHGAQNRPDPAALQKKLFDKLDVNGDGAIDQSELGSFLDYVSSSTGSASTDASKLFQTLDADGDGSISKADLANGFKSLFDALRTQLAGSKPADSSANTKQPDVSKLFSAMDTNGDGNISQDELGAFMSQKSEQAQASGGHRGHFMSRINELLDQYRAAASSATTASVDASSVSAIA